MDGRGRKVPAILTDLTVLDLSRARTVLIPSQNEAQTVDTRSGIDEALQAGKGARLDRALGAFSTLNSGIGALVIISMTVLICADIASRNLFSVPINGVSDYVSYAIVVCVYLQLGVTVRSGRLVRATFLIEHLDETCPVVSLWLETLFQLVSMAVMALAVRYLWDDFLGAWVDGEYLGSAATFRLSTWPFKGTVAVASAGAFLEMGAVLWRRYTKAEKIPALRRALVAASVLVALVCTYLAFDVMAAAGLDRVAIGLSTLAALLILIGLGMPIGFTLLVTSFVGIWLIRDNVAVAVNSVGISASAAVRSSGFGVIPLFVLMGLLLDRAGVGRDAFQVMAVLMKRITGGLGVATVGANAIFASITGSSIASATVFSRIAVPPMMEAGYTKKFSLGIVAGSSVLGMLIPPSLLMIIYGLLAEASIGDMFIAGIIPGLCLAVCFGILIVGLSRFRPAYAGRPQDGFKSEGLTGMAVLRGLGPVIVVVAAVMGGIYGGIFSPTEAGAVGALGALLVAFGRRALSFADLKQLILETGAITAGLLFLMIAASVYGRMLSMSTIPMQAASLIAGLGLSLVGFMLVYVVIVVILGMILDSVSIMLIMLPIALPVVLAHGGDLIWFGIVTVIAIEIGLLTPPFGLSVYVVKASLPEGFASLGEIFAAAAPFVFVMGLVTLTLIFVPWLATALL